MDFEIVEVGCDIEIKTYINGIPFYTTLRFSTKEEAREYLRDHNIYTYEEEK